MTLEELNPKGFAIDSEQKSNLELLAKVLTMVETVYGQKLTVTSGFRNLREQNRIDREAGRKVTLGSAHIKGAAVDLADANGFLKKWVMENLSLFTANHCYFEDFKYTPTWVHIQVTAPKSGKRFFIPYA